PIMGLARLRAGLKAEADPTRRAELVYVALRIGFEQGVANEVAPVFADDAAALAPQPTWANWAPTFVRALLIAGRFGAGGRWIAAARGSPISPADLIIAAAIAARDPAHIQAAQLALGALAQRTQADPEGAGARAALLFGLCEALGIPLPPEAEAR